MGHLFLLLFPQQIIQMISKLFFPTSFSMLTRITGTILAAVLVAWTYQAIRPPSPKLPEITSPRIQLRDGRHLAYKESGVLKHKAKFKIVVIHGFDSTKEEGFPASQETVNELGVYFVSFDRAGYGESDPNTKRDVRSEAMDIVELADQLEIGSKFYVIGFSMGGYPTWSCLKYIPHRLAGVALVVPAVNYWWPSFPDDLLGQVNKKILVQDQRTYWIAHHAPWLLYAWMTQKWIPTLAVLEGHPDIWSKQDKEIIREAARHAERKEHKIKARQQGVFESLHRDMIVVFSNWEFDPMNLSNPFPHNDGTVHIWQGYDDRIVPVKLQRFVAKKLPWIRYHEDPEGGHLFMYTNGWADAIVESLLTPKL